MNIKQSHGSILVKVIRMGNIDRKFRNRIVFLTLLFFTNELIFTKIIFSNDLEKALLAVTIQYVIRIALILMILLLSLFYYRKKMNKEKLIFP